MSTGGGGGIPSQQTTISQVKLPDWVDEAIQSNYGTVKDLAAQPYQPYAGPTLAPLSQDTLDAFKRVRDSQGTATADIRSGLKLASDLPAATTSLLNPYMERVAGDTTSNMMRQAALDQQSLDANAAARGAFGGDRTAVAERLLGSETQRNIGQAVNKIAATGWSQAQDAALRQAGLIGNLGQTEQRANIIDANALAQIGQTEQTQQQTGYAQALQEWQAAQNWPYQQAAILQSALAGTPYGTTVQSSQPYNTNPAASALGMATAGLGVLNNLPGAINNLSGLFKGNPSDPYGLFAGNTMGQAQAASTIGSFDPFAGMTSAPP